MSQQRLASLCLGVGAFFVFCGATEVMAAPPVPPPGATQCSVSNQRGENYTIAIAPDVNGVWPVQVSCSSSSSGKCTKYDYTVSSQTGSQLSHLDLAISADQETDLALSGPSPTLPSPILGTGGSLGFLKGTFHEYPITINPNLVSGPSNAHIAIVGPSVQRISTAFFTHGNLISGCGIQGPGVASNEFDATLTTATVLAAGGKCVAEVTFNPGGKVVNVTTTTPGCVTGTSSLLTINTSNGAEPLQSQRPFSVESLTIGTGTSTFYPPNRWVCTRSPCP